MHRILILTLIACLVPFLASADTLSVYASLTGKTVLMPSALPAVPDSVVSALALNGICLVDDSTSFVQMVPVSRRDQVKTLAPKPEPGAKLFDPKKVPSVGVLPSGRPLTEMERLEQEFDRLRKSFYDFMHLPDPSRRPASRLLGLYADLAGKTPVASQNLDGTGIWFHVETPLTKSELLYAIETTFLLNNLAIIPVDEHKIRVGHISELRKGD